MPQLRWTKVLLIALLALVLFFGAEHVYRRYFREEPFLDSLCRLEGVAGAELAAGKNGEILIITPEDSYRGQLQSLIAAVEKEVSGRYRELPPIEIRDRRSGRLDLFASAVSPDLYEAVRSGRYRSAAERIREAAELYELTAQDFTVDSRYLYLQARDGAGYLYMLVPLPPLTEGGAADA